MRGILFLTSFCISVVSSYAQSDLVSAGGEGAGTGGSMGFSVGQVFYTAADDGQTYETQGVQQGEDYGLMWTGTTSTDWSVGSNWSKGTVPTSTHGVVITAYPVNQPHITTSINSPTEVADVNLRNGSSLTIEAGNGLTVWGDLHNDGNMLIEADASGIGSLLTDGLISGSGTFQMQQYLQGSGGATPNGLFFYAGSPVADATAATFDLSSGNKLWSADETTTSYPQITNGSTVLDPMTGYVVRMGSNTTVTYSGTTYNNDDLTIDNLTRTGTTDNDRGYNLVSNPYPSTMSWDQINRTNVSTTMWYRTHQGTTMLYDTYNATSGIGTNNNGNGAINGDIPPTQAFWVRVPADGLTGELNFDNTLRSHAGWSSIYKQSAAEGLIRIEVSNGTVSDETIIVFNSDASNGFDDFDSQKFWASLSVPQLYTTVGTDSLVIKGLESVATNPVVDLGVKLPAQANYTFTVTENTLAEDVYLEDRSLNVFQNLNLDNTYDFTEQGGNIGERFALHFGMSITDIQNTDGFQVQVFSAGDRLNVLLSEAVEGNATVYDMAGRVIATEQLMSTSNSFQLITATGIYLVKLETDKGTSTHKIHL
ncbi:MAG: T9SS type A sorting domain-containing protein [Flavobacteriales bacterium]|nr:T9SS type A sorting domain-containing protein [Flavobacteriales bacterium]